MKGNSMTYDPEIFEEYVSFVADKVFGYLSDQTKGDPVYVAFKPGSGGKVSLLTQDDPTPPDMELLTPQRFTGFETRNQVRSRLHPLLGHAPLLKNGAWDRNTWT
jgi:hypothetical protein